MQHMIDHRINEELMDMYYLMLFHNLQYKKIDSLIVNLERIPKPAIPLFVYY
jgi:hypothetical protein